MRRCTSSSPISRSSCTARLDEWHSTCRRGVRVEELGHVDDDTLAALYRRCCVARLSVALRRLRPAGARGDELRRAGGRIECSRRCRRPAATPPPMSRPTIPRRSRARSCASLGDRCVCARPARSRPPRAAALTWERTALRTLATSSSGADGDRISATGIADSRRTAAARRIALSQSAAAAVESSRRPAAARRAAHREPRARVLEETGLRVLAGPLAYVSESYDGERQFLNATFVVSPFAPSRSAVLSEARSAESKGQGDRATIISWRWSGCRSRRSRRGSRLRRARAAGRVSRRYARYALRGLSRRRHHDRVA